MQGSTNYDFQAQSMDGFKGSMNGISGLEEQSATNALNHYTLVQGLYEKTNEQLYDYKREVAKLRQEINNMKNKIIFANDETQKTLTPFVDGLYQNLTLAINNQKEENNKLQNQIVELKKEKSQIQQLILASIQKVAALEDMVGNYSQKKSIKLKSCK